MSLLSERRKKLSDVPVDEMYVIYGEPGSGKTTLASTFPKSTEEKLLLIDINQGGTGSIPREYEDMIDVVSVYNFEEFDEIFTDVYNGYTLDEDGNEITLNYRTIVIDTITDMEYFLKKSLMTRNQKDHMTLQLWGSSKDEQQGIYTLLRELHSKTGAIVVATAHVRNVEDEDSSMKIRLPELQTSAARYISAKASYVWYTKVETEYVIDKKTNETNEKVVFNTYIEAQPGLATKCRKPPKYTGVIPKKIRNLTYDRFRDKVLSQIKKRSE